MKVLTIFSVLSGAGGGFVVDENTRIFINQLSSLNALYRTYGVSHDYLRENFSEKKCSEAKYLLNIS